MFALLAVHQHQHLNHDKLHEGSRHIHHHPRRPYVSTIIEPDKNGGGGAFSLNLNINLDVNTLLNQIGSAINVIMNPDKARYCQPDGGKWFSGESGGKVYSAYYHPTKWHRTVVKAGKNFFPTSPSWVKPGEWAVTYMPAALFNNAQYYYIQ